MRLACGMGVGWRLVEDWKVDIGGKEKYESKWSRMLMNDPLQTRSRLNENSAHKHERKRGKIHILFYPLQVKSKEKSPLNIILVLPKSNHLYIPKTTPSPHSPKKKKTKTNPILQPHPIDLSVSKPRYRNRGLAYQSRCQLSGAEVQLMTRWSLVLRENFGRRLLEEDNFPAMTKLVLA